jgi:hypothetical protein
MVDQHRQIMFKLQLRSRVCGVKGTVERDSGVLKACDKGCVVTRGIRASVERLGSTGLVRRGTRVEIDETGQKTFLQSTARTTTSGRNLAKIK